MKFRSFGTMLVVAALTLSSCVGCAPNSKAKGKSKSKAKTTAKASAKPVVTIPTRDPALWPFAVDSPWNSPIGTGAVFGGPEDPRTAAISSPDVYASINSAAWSFPVAMATASDPLQTIYSPSGDVTLRIPPGTEPAEPVGGDASLHVVDPTRRVVDEMWDARHSGTEWTAGHIVRTDLRGPGVGQGGARAYGGSGFGGLIRTWELFWGVMRHPLAMALPRSLQRMGPVWPAIFEDDGADETYGGPIPLGTLFAIPSSVNVESLGLSRQGLLIAKALQQFGAYDVDSTDGPMVFYAETSAEPWLGGARDDVRKLQPLLRVVTNNSPTSRGGGGWPLAPAAPPLP